MPVDQPAAIQILGSRIRARRTDLGLSLEAAAPLCGLHWSALGHIERGQRNVSVLNLLRIAGGLQVDPARLIEGLAIAESS